MVIIYVIMILVGAALAIFAMQNSRSVTIEFLVLARRTSPSPS